MNLKDKTTETFPKRNTKRKKGLPKNIYLEASLVAQWQGIRQTTQETWVSSLVGKIPYAAEQQGPCTTATEPVI